MSLFTPMTHQASWLRAGLYGEEGSGKSELAIQLIARTRKLRSDTRPIAIIDSEERANLKVDLVEKLTGMPAQLLQTKDFHTMVRGIEELVASKECSGIVIDQVTHYWDALVQSYLDGVNKNLALQNKPPRAFEPLRDSAVVKKDKDRGWARFVANYAHAPIDFAIVGRLGDKWGQVYNEEKQKMERGSIGDRMKTEGDFGYESILLIRMERIQTDGGHGRADKIIHRSHVIKDTSRSLEAGTSFDDAVGEAFDAHLTGLLAGDPPKAMNTTIEAMVIDSNGDTDYQRRTMKRKAVLGEIVAAMNKYHPGAVGADRTAKITLSEKHFGVKSGDALQQLPLETLEAGYKTLLVGLGEALPGDIVTAPEAYDPADNPLEA